jgi:hypothetical protein
MNQQDLQGFQQAVALAQAGQKAEAYNRLMELARNGDNSRDANLLMWIAFTAPNLAQAEQALSWAEKLDPNNQTVKSARQWLEGEKAKLAPAPPVQQPAPNYVSANYASVAVAPAPARPDNYNLAPQSKPSPASKLSISGKEVTFGKYTMPIWSLFLGSILILVIVGLLINVFTPPPTNAPTSTTGFTAAKDGTGPLVTSTKLGVTRASLQSYYEGLGFTFDAPDTVSGGKPRVMGKNRSGTALVELIGPANDLESASVMLDVHNGSAKSNATYMVGLLDRTAPALKSSGEWVKAAINVALDNDGDVRDSAGSVSLHMQIIKDASLLVLTVKG